MEHSHSSLAFKGSIIEAITEAKQQKKLFVVYKSGNNPESEHLETSTWNDVNVAESVLKYCVLLHILEGSPDASNFSAIYPQLPAPCITVVGYNGVQLLQSEGYVTPDFLASSLKKAWLSLQIKESTAALLLSGLASNKQVAADIFDAASFEQGSSSSNQESPPSDRGIICSEARSPETSEVIIKDDDDKRVIEDQIVNEPSPASDSPEKLKSKSIDGYASKTKKTEELSKVESADLNNHDGEHVSVKDNPESSSHDNVANKTSYQEIDNEAQKTTQIDKDENEGVEKACGFYSPSRSTDVHLNIRLPDGSSLQVKLPMVDTLEMVKDYVDQNRPNSFGAYDLAIPYPRQVFNDQDLSKQLSELGLSNRQALVVVLRPPSKGVSSRGASNYGGSSSTSNEGYWGTVKRMLSYVNPFSYLAGSPVQETHGSNSSLQRETRGAGRPDSTSSASTSSASSNKARQLNQFGSNIHTLKRDEDDERFSERNTFWNGNSTQFGGDDNGK